MNSTRRHDIVFHANGRIDIMARPARLLGLQPGDAVNVCFDGSEYYLFVHRRSEDMVGRHLCRVHPSNRGSRFFRLNSLALARQMLALCGSPAKAGFWCGSPITDPDGSVKLPIVTRINVFQK